MAGGAPSWLGGGRVDVRMLPSKLYYLLQFSGYAFVTPFVPVFYESQGLGKRSIGAPRPAHPCKIPTVAVCPPPPEPPDPPRLSL